MMVAKQVLGQIIWLLDKPNDTNERIFIPHVYAIMVKNTLSNWEK